MKSKIFLSSKIINKKLKIIAKIWFSCLIQFLILIKLDFIVKINWQINCYDFLFVGVQVKKIFWKNKMVHSETCHVFNSVQWCSKWNQIVQCKIVFTKWMCVCVGVLHSWDIYREIFLTVSVINLYVKTYMQTYILIYIYF